ncbi:MAG: DUF1963 domain-containing protein [Roseibium album]|uniref:DUF1963 domain-containing protein n=1 Tax=Roseibium album TaxID=311410 RepID=UPI0032ECA665
MEKSSWRSSIEKPCSSLTVGGFRPSNELTSSCFGEIRAAEDENWPHLENKPLWPVCQLNLLDAPYVPDCLRDVAMLQFFVHEEYWRFDQSIVDVSKPTPSGPFFLKIYKGLDALKFVDPPNHDSPFKPLEAKWCKDVRVDYPTHDCMPFDFDALDIGDYCDQDGVETVFATKLGGWPSCVQSEPWWDYRKEGKDFEFALQFHSEEKANCWWGDNGVVYFARHKSNTDVWAVDWQCL